MNKTHTLSVIVENKPGVLARISGLFARRGYPATSMNQVAEGVKAASVIMEFADKYGINMPIAREVDQVINHGATVEQAYRGLMAQKPGHEVDGTPF